MCIRDRYLYSDIFAQSFATPQALASFFGVYLAVTNLAEIAIEVALTPFLIRRLGVPATNLVHPLLMLATFAGLVWRFDFAMAVGARVNRELLDNALATPVRSLLYNAMPLQLRGRMRAFLEGIVVYAGMSIAGIVLLALERPDPLWLCAAGAAAGFVYLAANFGVRRAYLGSLVTQLRAGRLDLADVHGEIGGWEASKLAELWEQLLRDEGSRPSRSLLQLVPELAARTSGAMTPRAASSGTSWSSERDGREPSSRSSCSHSSASFDASQPPISPCTSARSSRPARSCVTSEPR